MIKSFLYLDEQKMYSLSSQIFEGVTEYVLSEDFSEKVDMEDQKGPFFSGKILADVIKMSSKATEKKFLHDYSYSVFEKSLVESSRVVMASEDLTSHNFEKEKMGKSFIRVKARVKFNDYEKICELLARFNDIGKAIAHVTGFEEIQQKRKALEELINNAKSKNEMNRLKASGKELVDLVKLAKESGLQQEQGFLDDLSLLIQYGFANRLEVLQGGRDVLFSSCLKKECLREDIDLVIQKFSRKSNKELVVFGMITQELSSSFPDFDDKSEIRNLKAALLNLVEHLANIEATISGKLEREIVIDPIAIYAEV